MKKLLNTKKKKVLFVVAVLILVIAIAIALSIILDKGKEVEVATVKRNDVSSHYDTTGTVTSISCENYYAYEGMVPIKINVAPGDIVHKGDILATFDTSTLDSAIKEKKQAYNNACSQYNTAIKNKNDKVAQEKELDKQIKALEKEQSNSDVETPDFSQMTEAEIEAYVNGLASGTTAIDTTQLKIILLKAEKALLSVSDSSSSIISMYKTNVDTAKKEYDEIIKERDKYKNGIVATKTGKVTNTYIEEGKAYEVVEESSNTDLSALLSGVTSTSDISSLLGMLGTSNDNAEKGIAITVDYFDGYIINFSLGKYDIETVKVGMPATITYLDYKYEGKVSYISATADSTTDVMSSLMGSTTGSASAVAARVSITNPDEKIIVGFDANVSILIDSKENVLTIPVESLVIKEGETYIYMIDDETGTAKLVKVEVGLYSDTLYEIVSGLNEGDKVILNASKIDEGEKVFTKEK